MGAIIEPIITFRQELIVLSPAGTLGSMQSDTTLIDFATRINEVCDDMGVPPKGQARQSTLAKIFDVSQKGARKWLEGEGFPEFRNCIRIALWADVNIEWLLTGRGPKRGNLQVDCNATRIGEAITSMAAEPQQAALDFIQYKIERGDALFTSDQSARYVKMIESIKSDLALRKNKDRDKGEKK